MRTNYFLLFLLFVATGCNFNQGKNQGAQTDAFAGGHANAQYVGEYNFGLDENGEEGPFGSVYFYLSADDSLSFDLSIGMGAPSYNSGIISGEVKIVNGKGLFTNEEYGSCILEFVFAKGTVHISQKEGGYECGFGHNVFVNNAFNRKVLEPSPYSENVITPEVLWDIFLKIPRDSVHNGLFVTPQERRQARMDRVFMEGRDQGDNFLRYDDTDYNGIRNFMGIACYPMEGNEKLLALFYMGGGIDTYITPFKQSYEYDLATGELTPVACPLDPYTEDEFFNTTDFSPALCRKLQKIFCLPERDVFLNHIYISREGFSVYFAAFDAFDDDWDAYGEYLNKVAVERRWDGKRFVRLEWKQPASEELAALEE